MKKNSLTLFWLLFGITLVACGSGAASETLQIVQPTDTAFISPTSTAPFVLTVDPLTPSAIAQFFKTLEAKQTPTRELLPTPSYRDCSGNMFFMSLGKWGLCHGLRDPVTIINQSNRTWQFSYEEYYRRNVPNPCTRLLHLTDDENFLYFSMDAECELIEPGFVSSIGVFRMNLINGDVKEVLKASYDFDSYTGNYYTVSISPTGRRLAYIASQDRPLKLNVFDLKTGETLSFLLEEKYIYGGAYTWSEAGTKLVLKLESKTDSEHFISMMFLDLLKDNSMVTFIKDQEYHWIMSEIEVTDDEVKVTPIGDAPLSYDIETGILSPINQ